MRHHDPLDQQIAHTLNTVADQVPVRDRLAEFDTNAVVPSVRRWRFAEMPALAGAAAFVVGLALVGGVLLTLRSNTSEPSGPAVPVETTSTSTITTTQAEIAEGAGGPCLDERNNLIGETGIQVSSGGRTTQSSTGPSTIGYCPGHPDHQEVSPSAEDRPGNMARPTIHVSRGAELVLTAPGYPGAEVDASWLHGSASEPAAAVDLVLVAPTTWTFIAPAETGTHELTVGLDWFEGDATYSVFVEVDEDITQAGGIPSDFDPGPELAAEIRSELPPTYLRLGFGDGVVLTTVNGQALGHINGQPEPPTTSRDRTQSLTEELVNEWPIPEGCVVDTVIDTSQLRVLCLPTGGSLEGPTVEILFKDGSSEIVAQLTEPPSDLEGAYRIGQFLEVIPSPWNRGSALAQFTAECESRLAVMIDDGIVSHIDGTPWWGEAYPDGESVAIGWGPDQRALVWRFNGGCNAGLAQPGIYVYDQQGFGNLLFAVPNELQWVEVVNPEHGTATAAIYPARTAAELEALVASNEPLQEDIEVVASFATDILEISDPDVRLVGDGTDSTRWEVVGDGLTVSVGTRLITWGTDGSPIWAITNASTFTSDDEFFLTAQVANNSGSWTADLHFPQIGDETTVVFSSGDWTTQTTTDGDSVTLQLPDEPRETPRLSITFRKGSEIVGFHGILLPIGEFVAG